MHRQGGASNPEHLAAGRALLGVLQNHLRLGGIQSGAERLVLRDGTLIEAFMHMGIPSVRITPTGRPRRVRRVFELFAAVNTVANIEIVRLGLYESDDAEDAPLVRASNKVMELLDTIAIGTGQDPIGLAVDDERGLLYIANFSDTSPNGDSVIVADLRDFAVLGTTRPAGFAPGDFHPFRLAASRRTGQTAIVGYTQSAATPTSARLDWPTAPTVTPITALGVDGRFNEDVALSPDGALAYVCNSAGGLGPARITVVDMANGEVVTEFPVHDGFFSKITCSRDGAFLYFTGKDDADPYPEDEADQSNFVAKMDAATGAILAKINGGSPYSLDVSPKGDRLIVNDAVNPWLWLYDTELMPAIADYTSEALMDQPGVERIFGIDSDGGTGFTSCEVRFTPDGKQVVCTTRDRTTVSSPYQLTRITLEGLTVERFDSPADALLNELVLYKRRLGDRVLED
jgi:DNA-binding beta-propeller fold protein YncE